MPPAPPGHAAPGGRALLLLVVVGGLIGIPAALAAALLLAAVHGLEHLLWSTMPARLHLGSTPWYLLLGLPLVGGLIVLFARLALPGDGGEEPIEGLSSKPTPVSHGPGIVLAALGSLPFGVVLGPEAPVIAVGSVVGVAVAWMGRFKPRQLAVLSGAGSFAAMSALFGGPVVAGLLLVEGSLGLGSAALPILLPGLVAAAVGYVLFVGFGNFGGLNAPGLLIPNLPLYDGLHPGDLLLGVLVGALSALLITGVHRVARAILALRGGRVGTIVLLPLGSLGIGVLALAGARLGADPMDILFSGQASVPVVVTASSTMLVLVLFLGKALGYAISLGCGFRGGPIFPAIFLGVALASFPEVWFGTSPTLVVAVGAAAGMAAQTRLLFAPLIFASLLVGKNGLDTVPAVVFASVAAWLTVQALARYEIAGPRRTVTTA